MAAGRKLPVAVTNKSRLKREDCLRTEHDSAFSEWKILIGPSDWQDHSLGKEGAERYRIHNLPNCASCPGVYELGIAVKVPRSGRNVGLRLDQDFIIPVYLGQADNVRNRLQQYGRDGAHLENGYSNSESNDGKDASLRKALGLFTKIFSRGLFIVYRWAPMKTKRDAEKTEMQLLEKFDYAWNQESNCTRRPNAIFRKLDESSSSTFHIGKKLRIFHKKQGIRIEVCESLPLENGSSFYANEKGNGLLSRILKFGRSQPRLVSVRFGVNEGSTVICGVALGQGSVCIRPPIEGRKRCAEHRGMKVNAFIRKSVREEKPPAGGTSIGSGDNSYPDHDGQQSKKFSESALKLQPSTCNCQVDEDFSFMCGIALDDGSFCKKKPIQGRKRCEEHKGRRIRGSPCKSLRDEEHNNYLHGPISSSGTYCNDHKPVSFRTEKLAQMRSQTFIGRSSIAKKCEAMCGMILEDGIFCTKQPVEGRKRCDEHKGRKVKRSISDLPKEIPRDFDCSYMRTVKIPRYLLR